MADHLLNLDLLVPVDPPLPMVGAPLDDLPPSTIVVTNTNNDLNNTRNNAILSAFFPTAHLNEIINQSNCKGIRIYPGVFNGIFSFGLIGCRGRKQRNIVDTANLGTNNEDTKCFVANDSSASQQVTRNDFVGMLDGLTALVNQSRASGSPAMSNLPMALSQAPSPDGNMAKAFFEKTDIQTLLTSGRMGNTVQGIRFYTMQIHFVNNSNNFPTAMAIAVDNGNNEIDNSARASALPCPPYCGDGAYLRSGVMT